MVHVLTIPAWHPPRWRSNGPANRAARLQREAVVREKFREAAILGRVPSATGRRRVDLVLSLPVGQTPGIADWHWNATLAALASVGLLVDVDHEHAERGTVSFRDGKKATQITLTELADDASQELPDDEQGEQVQQTARPLPTWYYIPLFPSESEPATARCNDGA